MDQLLIYLHHQQVGIAPKERGGRGSCSLQQAAFLCLSARRHLSALFLRATTMPHGCLSPKASQRDRKTLGLSPCLTRQKTCYFTWQYHCPESLPQKAECRGDALLAGTCLWQKQTIGQRPSSWLLMKPGLKEQAPAGLLRTSLIVPQAGTRT